MRAKHPENPIAQVRAATGLSGAEFAASLSLSDGAIRNMERGVLVPGEETRDLFFIVYGVDSDSIAKAKGTALFQRTSKPYTRDSYIEWKRLTTIDKEKAREIIDIEVDRVRWLLEAAALNRSLFPTMYRLESAMEKIAKQSSLVGLIATVMMQEGRSAGWFQADHGVIRVAEHVLKQLGLDADGKPSKVPTPEA